MLWIRFPLKALGPGGQVMLNEFRPYKRVTNVPCKKGKENGVEKPEMRVLGGIESGGGGRDWLCGGEEKGRPLVGRATPPSRPFRARARPAGGAGRTPCRRQGSVRL